MNNNTQKNNLISNIAVFVVVILILCFIGNYIMKVVKEKEDAELKKYTITMPVKGNGQNMNNCPRGCVRGACKHKNNNNNKLSHMCTFDYQCQYCNDRKTNMFYVSGDYENEKEIVPKYAEHQQPSELDNLNNSIKNNNVYINELNSAIKKMNNENKKSSK
jgi:hypothetical protein